MRNSRAQLLSRLEALEAQLISPLQKRIDAMSSADCATYEDWKRECRLQFQRYSGEPDKYWEAVLDGDIERPTLDRRIERQLFPVRLPLVTPDTPLADVAAWYHETRDNVR
mgnify:CR=1 FL=1